MDMNDIRALKTEELHVELERLRRHLFDLRAQAVTEKLADVTQLGKTKKDIARILTVMRQRGETQIEEKHLHMEAVAARQKRGPREAAAAKKGRSPAREANKR